MNAENNDLVSIRRAKGEHWRDYGFDPYGHMPETTKVTTLDVVSIIASASTKPTLGEQEIHEEDSFVVAGRVMLSRKQGKLRFLQLKDHTGTIQLFVLRTHVGERTWEIFELIDPGDYIQVTGPTMYTKTGELSIRVDSIHPLTKALKAPAKWDTVENVELKYRQRYVDLIENQSTKNVFLARSFLIKTIRSFLDSRYFIEVETPVLTSTRSGANAKPFETHHNALDMNLYMRIAPELYLKRLVVGGMERVYELGRLFRNEGISTRHNPEFTAVEYYQAFADYNTLIQQTKDMLQYIHTQFFGYFVSVNQSPEFQKESLSFALDNFAEVRMVDSVKDAYARLGIETDVQTLTGKQLYEAFERYVEPHLTEYYRTEDGTKSLPVFIKDYPVEVSPLAKKFPRDQQYLPNVELTERFELFVDGKELANAFTELNDPEEQAKRFRDQLQNRASGDQEAMDFDEDYINALMYGLPPCAGFGMGVDRLVMLLTGQSCIRDVILFPLMK